MEAIVNSLCLSRLRKKSVVLKKQKQCVGFLKYEFKLHCLVGENIIIQDEKEMSDIKNKMFLYNNNTFVIFLYFFFLTTTKLQFIEGTHKLQFSKMKELQFREVTIPSNQTM